VAKSFYSKRKSTSSPRLPSAAAAVAAATILPQLVCTFSGAAARHESVDKTSGFYLKLLNVCDSFWITAGLRALDELIPPLNLCLHNVTDCSRVVAGNSVRRVPNLPISLVFFFFQLQVRQHMHLEKFSVNWSQSKNKRCDSSHAAPFKIS